METCYQLEMLENCDGNQDGNGEIESRTALPPQLFLGRHCTH